MKQRVITGLILAAVFIPAVIFMFAPLVFPILLAILSAIAVYEILTVTGCRNKLMIYGTAALSAVMPFLVEYRVPATGRDQVALRSVRGCRPFSAENDPLDHFPGAPNPSGPLRTPSLVCFSKARQESNFSAMAYRNSA